MLVGVVEVGELVGTAEGVLVMTADEAAFEEIAAVTEGATLLGTAVGFPPFKHVQALEILAGTWDQRAANAGKVWVGALVYAEQNGFAATAKSSKSSRQASWVHVAVARS